jgi:hypothetical protein
MLRSMYLVKLIALLHRCVALAFVSGVQAALQASTQAFERCSSDDSLWRSCKPFRSEEMKVFAVAVKTKREECGC